MKGRGILLDSEGGDLLITPRRDAVGMITGGLVIGDVTRQNQLLLLALYPGELKAYPTLGVGIADMLLDEADTVYWRTRIRQTFEQDGLKIRRLTLESGKEINIDAEY